MGTATRRRLLDIARSDTTFVRTELRGRPVWAGKCLHCNAALVVADDGTPVGPVTVEHIVPRTAGGSDELANLALACARCNHEKGKRHDVRYGRGARAQEVVDRLLDKRRQRLRDPEDPT